LRPARGQSEPVIITIFAAAALILGLAVLSYMNSAMSQARSQQELRNALLDNSARTVIVMEASTGSYVALSVMRIGTPARIYVATANIQTLASDTVQLCNALTSQPATAGIEWADGSTPAPTPITVNAVQLSTGSDYIPCSGSIMLYDLGYIEPGAPSKPFKVSKGGSFVAVVAFIRLGNDFYEVARWYG